MSRSYFAVFVAGVLSSNTIISAINAQQNNVAAPLTTESFSNGATAAVQSVVRVICPQQDSQGTGFLHKSGMIITAAHVVKDCVSPRLLLPNNTFLESTIEGSDLDFDFAILHPVRPITVPALSIVSNDVRNIGTQISTWGFPIGYFGLRPMLSVGVLSGEDAIQSESGKIIVQYVVNAAFNSGNSGGPLLQVETGSVIGIVVSKVAPISSNAMAALKGIQETQYGFNYEARTADGKVTKLVEGQVVAMVLDELRKQVQLVIGHAGRSIDLKSFLRYHGIDP